MPALRLPGFVRCFGNLVRLFLSFHIIVFLLLCWTQPASVFVESAVVDGTYKLGFLSPTPGTNIPANLAIEWRSAFRVAVDVLNNNRSYLFEPYIEDSDYNTYLAVQAGASRLLRQEGLIGAVGPACSGAAVAAATIFDEEGPAALVSFAATAEPLSNRTYFPTFFRTVYTDGHQVKAIGASMERLHITNATVLYTKDYYSTLLAQEINKTVGGVRMVLLEPGINTTVNKEQLKTVLNSLKPSNFVILVVQPTAAEEIWTMAYQMDKIRYPWWYFGSDGATAFDPVDIDQGLVSALEGEIGIAPYGGDFWANPQCSSFYMHWQDMKDRYPGLPALGPERSRSYVPYLFDAVMAFYEVVDDLLETGLEVTRLNVFKSFGAIGRHRLRFNGCTGIVEFDPETGARSVTAQPPLYDLVSMSVHSWELKGRIANESLVNLLPLQRPGRYPAASGQELTGPEPSGRKKPSGGVIAGIVFLVVAIIVLITACFVYYAKKYNAPMFNRL